jgi:hypothetical protein
MDTQPTNLNQPITTSQPVVPIVPVAQKSSHLIPILLSSLITALILVGFYLLFLNENEKNTIAGSASTPTVSDTSESNELLYAKEADDADLVHYVLKDKKSSIDYPKGWTIVDNSQQLDLDGQLQWSQDIVLTKDGYTLTSRNPINWGPGICIFPESPDYNKDDVYGSKYATYTEIAGQNGNYRRVKTTNPENSKLQSWGICVKVEPNGYSDVVGFGGAGYTTPLQYDESILATMDEILMSIKKEKL